jgi:glycosyltransferase involved in cell wall biosynthesis
MPAYNTASWIVQAIQSVFNQSYDDWDLLVVDDCSQDETVDLVYSMMDPRISIVEMKEHLGVAGATRVGIEHAIGDVITVLDSDDLLTPHSLSRVMPLFEANEKLGYVWTNFRMIPSGRIGWCGPTPEGCHLFDALVSRRWWAACHQRFFRKSIYLRSPGIRDDIPAASDLQVAILVSSTGCDCSHVSDVTYLYRTGRKGNISSNRKFQKWCADQLIRWARNGFRR